MEWNGNLALYGLVQFICLHISAGNITNIYPFRRQPHTMVKQTQIIRRQNHKMVKNSQKFRCQFVDKLFECV